MYNSRVFQAYLELLLGLLLFVGGTALLTLCYQVNDASWLLLMTLACGWCVLVLAGHVWWVKLDVKEQELKAKERKIGE